MSRRHPNPQFDDTYLAEVVAQQDRQREPRQTGDERSSPGGSSVSKFEVVSQTAGSKVVGKMYVGGEVPEGAADVDLLAPFPTWAVAPGADVYAALLTDGTWLLLPTAPAGSYSTYEVVQVNSGNLVIDWVRAH